MRTLAATLNPPAVALRRSLERVSLTPRQRRRLLFAATGLVLSWALYTFWARDLSLWQVQRVTVTGLTTANAPELRRALTATARDMTTLHVRHDELDRAIAGYPAVARLEVAADFPHALRIRVVEQKPVAVLVSGGQRAPVGADGSLLRGMPLGAAVPEVRWDGALPDKRVPAGAARREVMVASAAPAPLRRRLRDVRTTRERGLVARFRRGPEIIFGDASVLDAKWAAAAAVLAHPAARGASYVDVRLPDRPAVGGLPEEAAADGAGAVRPGGLGGALSADEPAAAPGTGPSAARPSPTPAAPTTPQAAPTPQAQPQVEVPPNSQAPVQP